MYPHPILPSKPRLRRPHHHLLEDSHPLLPQRCRTRHPDGSDAEEPSDARVVLGSADADDLDLLDVGMRGGGEEAREAADVAARRLCLGQ